MEIASEGGDGGKAEEEEEGLGELGASGAPEKYACVEEKLRVLLRAVRGLIEPPNATDELRDGFAAVLLEGGGDADRSGGRDGVDEVTSAKPTLLELRGEGVDASFEVVELDA